METTLWQKLPLRSRECLRQINVCNTPRDLFQTLWQVLTDFDTYCDAETMSRCVVSRQNNLIMIQINDILLTLDYPMVNQ